MSRLFKIIPSNFFQLFASPNKDIYIDCLLILESLANEDKELNIQKNLAIDVLEKYFDDKVKIFLEEENQTEIINDNRQKAFKVLNNLKKNGWLAEERVNHCIVNLNFFDYSLEMIYFLKKILNKIKPESIGNIYSIYSLLKLFLSEKNYVTFKEASLKTQSLLIKLKVLKANIYRFYYQLTNTNFHNNVQNVLEQLLLDYKKNFFDSSYYLLKTTDNFFKYRRQINFFLQQIDDEPKYIQLLTEQFKIINSVSEEDSYNNIINEFRTIKDNLQLIDQIMVVIDQKNEQYLQIACEKILFFENKKNSIKYILYDVIKMVLKENKINNDFFNLCEIKNLDKFSLYKPRAQKSNLIVSSIDLLSIEMKNNLNKKKKIFLERDYFYDKKNINIFVKKLLNSTKNPFKASEMSLSNDKDISRLILIYLFSGSVFKNNNIYQIQALNQRVTCNNVTFSNFLIFLKPKNNNKH
ncbi:Wadjet anti-phage system protein JetA family protein [Candidatus Phytoplasma palmae]|uniref:Wadjet anti-phage system protein JetA family protein n=1 Tax=Candidatus Phytoplasma palmae TaxID=85624 RepID=UPI00399062BE